MSIPSLFTRTAPTIYCECYPEKPHTYNVVVEWLKNNAGNIACGIGIALCFAYLLGLPEFHW